MSLFTPLKSDKADTPESTGPLFILGAPRSGTSLLYKLLCLHPEAAWVSNYVRRAPGVMPLATINRAAVRWPQMRHRVWFGEDGSSAYAYGRSRSVAERLFPQPVEGEPVFRRAGIPEVAETADASASQQRKLHAALKGLEHYSGGSVVISKRIAHNRRIPLLTEAEPNGRFLCIVRDGRAVTASLLRVNWWPDTTDVWWYDGTPRDWEERGGNPVELAARHWVYDSQGIEAGLSSVADSKVQRISYEQLVQQPREVLRQVAAFAGLPPSRAWEQALDRVSFPNQNDSWPAKLGADRELVEQIQEPMLRSYGYLGNDDE